MEYLLIYVYNICWPITDEDAVYNTKDIATNSYIKIPRDTFSNPTERSKYIDFILYQDTGVVPLPYEYSLEYVCQL